MPCGAGPLLLGCTGQLAQGGPRQPPIKLPALIAERKGAAALQGHSEDNLRALPAGLPARPLPAVLRPPGLLSAATAGAERAGRPGDRGELSCF